MSKAPQNAFSAVRHIKNLVLIEAPGKLGALTFALRRAGLGDFHVLATQGHIMDYPHDLQQLGIDAHLSEPGRKLMKPMIAQTIQKWAEKADCVLIATDADQEGDVLAWDLFSQVVPNHPKVKRIRLRSLDADGIFEAFSNPDTVEAKDAWPGAARRIFDRLVGAAFSGQQDAKNEGSAPVGRVQSALLGAAAADPLYMGQATLVLPSCDSRDPYVAVVDVFPENRQQIEDLLGLCQRFAKSGQCVATGDSSPAEPLKPWCYGEGVLATAEATNRSVTDVAASMQHLYETGRISYPRSTANAVTPQGIGRLEKIAERNGIRISPGRIAQFTRQSRHAHESSHPLGTEADLSSPLLLLSQDDAVLSMMARHLVACGQPHLLHRPDPSSMPAWGKNIPGVQFSKVSTTWLNPWPRRKPETGFKSAQPVEHALRLALKNGLGRPSTQVGHAMKFASRDILNANMNLTAKARSWIDNTPAILLDPSVSRRIEEMIGQSAEASSDVASPAVLVRDLLQGLNLWASVEKTLEQGVAFKPNAGALTAE